MFCRKSNCKFLDLYIASGVAVNYFLVFKTFLFTNLPFALKIKQFKQVLNLFEYFLIVFKKWALYLKSESFIEI